MMLPISGFRGVCSFFCQVAASIGVLIYHRSACLQRSDTYLLPGMKTIIICVLVVCREHGNVLHGYIGILFPCSLLRIGK